MQNRTRVGTEIIPDTRFSFTKSSRTVKLSSDDCRSTNPLAADAPDLTSFASVEEWLNSIKMTRYLENFHEGDINTMDAVVNLTVKDLTELGITLVGHQKKIMNSVQNIRAQIRVNGSGGFLV